MTDAALDPATDDGPLSKTYDAPEVESRWYAVWEKAGYFQPDVEAVLRHEKHPYVIMMPPPNVTGSLHMGHALGNTIQDLLIRRARMQGKAALWLPGVDHAGIATQSVVERELKRHEGKSRHDLGRDKFLERVWEWKDKYGHRIVEQIKGMGASADWSRERFTMDEQCNRAVREAFVRMWNDGLIYRGERLVNWDPVTQTALSDEEVEHEEKDGELWRFAYPVKGHSTTSPLDLTNPTDATRSYSAQQFVSGEELVVATTRPETMLGDVAVAVHPDDERYTHLVGKHLVHPFFADRVVVVVADASVDREFGTGAVKVTPAHDPNDFETGQRHGLPMINIFTLDAAINDVGGAFQGLPRERARTAVKAALEQLGLTRGTQPIKHNVSVSQRSGAVVEPMLSRQFFVKGEPLAKLALHAVASGETRIVPEHWRKTWDHFMLNIRDWCISRQLWWGHRIPVFYDVTKLDEAIEADANRKGGDTEASRAQARGVSGGDLVRIALNTLDDDLVRTFATASIEDLAVQEPTRYVQEDDVLDTWFSSGLWPFSTLGWPDNTRDLQAFYPGAVLETASDILFFWVARMVMMGCYLMDGKSPFKDVFLHAIVRDAYGKKMSKSLGNAIDPLDVINGITLPELIAKTRTYPIPEKKIESVLKGLEKEYPEGIPASGADGLRFSLAALSGQGRDVKLSIPRVAGYRAFLNKIWNATRFALMRVGDVPILPLHDVKADLSVADRWILSRLQVATQVVSEAIDAYRFDEAANAIYQFFWSELCDLYIEMVKGPLADDVMTPQKQAVRSTFLHVLDASMRLLHPICPFQTEEIWQQLPGREVRWPGVASVCIAAWPTVEDDLVDESAETAIKLVDATVTLIRNVRQESGLSPRQPVVVDVVVKSDDARAVLLAEQGLVQRLACTDTLTITTPDGYAAPKMSAVHSDGVVEVVVHLAGLIDPAKERARLEKQIEKASKEKGGLDKRMSNAEFIASAPPDVVAKLTSDIAAVNDRVLRLQAALTRLS